jgi:hypothetical protein
MRQRDEPEAEMKPGGEMEPETDVMKLGGEM